MKFEQLKERVLTWLGEHVNAQRFKISETSPEKDVEEARGVMVNFWSEHHRYTIVVFQPFGPIRPKGYIGASYSNRAAYPGETFTRGSDLGDGEFSKKVFVDLLLGIMNQEMLEIPIKPPRKLVGKGGPKVRKPNIDDKIMNDISKEIHDRLAAQGFMFSNFSEKPIPGHIWYYARKGAIASLFLIEVTQGEPASASIMQSPPQPEEPSIVVTGWDGTGKGRTEEAFRHVISLADPNCVERAVSYITTNAHGALREIL